MIPSQALLVAAGAVPGACLRFLLVNHLAERLPSRPWGTLVVNLLACFALGWLLPLLQRPDAPPGASLLLITGFLGSLSTFSTLMLELLTVRSPGSLVRLTLGSLLGGCLALMAGLALGR
ncbi:MAG: fluoride efflux transporter FluC [Cyanobacteriota bacterium]